MQIRIQTKKVLICFAVMLFAAAMMSCGKKKTEEFTFRAVITEIKNGSMLVTPVEGSDELRSSDSFRVTIENMPSSPEPEVGDIVEITYDGGIQETYPAGLDHVFNIVVVEKAAKTDGQDSGSTVTIESAMGNEEVTDYETSESGQSNASVAGPYGEISVDVPAGWSASACHVDEEGMMYGLYGLILKPEGASDGQIELFCTDTFGVCGTGLVQEEITLAGGKATVGTYDEHKYWDYINFGEGDPNKTKCQIVAQHTNCDSWTEEMWEEALLVLDSMKFDRSKAEGGIGQFIRESENDEIAVIMEALHVIPTGCIVRFSQYDRRDTGELIYGQ